MSIVGAFDVHRRQLTVDYLDTVTGELKRGRVAPADREHLQPAPLLPAGNHRRRRGLGPRARPARPRGPATSQTSSSSAGPPTSGQPRDARLPG